MKFLIINGPNINFLGIREKAIYGDKTYDDLVAYILDYADNNHHQVKVLQTNSESKIIDYLQEAHFLDYDYILLNAGAYTHYSYAVRDAVNSISKKVIEVHLSKVDEREDFRKISVLKDVVEFSVSGHGFDSYIMAMEGAVKNG